MYSYFIVRHGLARGEAWAWQCLSLGLGLWFGVDSTLSAVHGVWLNVAGSVGFLVLYAVPLVALAPRYLGRREPLPTAPPAPTVGGHA